MGEDECGAGNVADLAVAGGDVLESAPALGERGEAAFAEAAQGALEGIAGSGANIEFVRVTSVLIFARAPACVAFVLARTPGRPQETSARSRRAPVEAPQIRLPSTQCQPEVREVDGVGKLCKAA